MLHFTTVRTLPLSTVEQDGTLWCPVRGLRPGGTWTWALDQGPGPFPAVTSIHSDPSSIVPSGSRGPRPLVRRSLGQVPSIPPSWNPFRSGVQRSFTRQQDSLKWTFCVLVYILITSKFCRRCLVIWGPRPWGVFSLVTKVCSSRNTIKKLVHSSILCGFVGRFSYPKPHSSRPHSSRSKHRTQSLNEIVISLL